MARASQADGETVQDLCKAAWPSAWLRAQSRRSCRVGAVRAPRGRSDRSPAAGKILADSFGLAGLPLLLGLLALAALSRIRCSALRGDGRERPRAT
jgi:hypothetical protein